MTGIGRPSGENEWFAHKLRLELEGARTNDDRHVLLGVCG